MRRALSSGWVRLFLVAWPAWAYWRWRQVNDEWSQWFSASMDVEWLLSGALLPPAVALAAWWVSRAFAPRPTAPR